MSKLRNPVGPQDHVSGDANASVTLVEYGDYQCPYCGEAFPIVERLREQWGDRLRFVFRHFPLTEAHPEALNAAEVAELGGAQGRFWDAHAALYENQDQLGSGLYGQIAGALKVPAAELHEALDAGTYEAKIRGDFNGGVRSGVNGTPSFFINGTRYDGSFDYDELAAALSEAAGR